MLNEKEILENANPIYTLRLSAFARIVARKGAKTQSLHIKKHQICLI